MSPTRTKLVEWLATKEVSGSTLDIGGNIWSMQGKVKSFGGEYKTMDESDWDLNHEMHYFGEFDNIFCTEVMQFLYDPHSALARLRTALKPGGKLYLSFHLTHPPMKDHDYLRYTRKGIEKLLQVTGLKTKEFLEPLPGYYLVQCYR